MPPKKVHKTVKKTVQVKTLRGRPKNVKSLQQSETEDKTKPPEVNSTSNDQNNDRVVILTKNDINIMLANEVVERQFSKKSTLSKDPANEVVLDLLKTKTKPVLKRKRLLKSKLLNGENVSEEKPKRNIKQALVMRKFRNATNKIKNSVPQKNKSESIPESSKNKTKKLGRPKIGPQKEKHVVNKATTNDDCETKPKTPRRKLSLNRKAVTCGPRTRRQASEVMNEVEPVALIGNVPPQKGNNEVSDTNANESDLVLHSESVASLSELSWTKDISSSSTTTCATVSSKDFFRIDNKIPILKLTNIDRKIRNEENNNHCDVNKKRQELPISIRIDDNIFNNSAINSEHCDKNSDRFCKNEKGIETYDDNENFPCTQFVSNLSTSSSDSCSDEENFTQNNPTAVNKMNDTLEKLSSKLKNFDLEILNWIGYRNGEINRNTEKMQEKLYQDKRLKEEMNVIIQCRNIKRILAENSQATDAEPIESANCNIHTNFENTMNNENIDESHNIGEHNSLNESNCPEENVDFEKIESSKERDLLIDGISFDDDDDDEDDTLSLYAESITGIESSTKNSKIDCTVNHLNEEYVPKPLSVKFKSPEIMKYHPTKTAERRLSEPSAPQNNSLTNVCEKHNADSTSIYKEPDSLTSLDEKNLSSDNNTIEEKKLVTLNSVTKLIPKSPILMDSIYKHVKCVSSMAFKGICFFNLISNCKKNACKFPHVFLEVDAVKNKILKLTDTAFIQEYMLLRCWPGLKFKYGMCFVEECIQRKLTRIVVEMAFDFIHMSSKVIVIEIVETILLYLNNVDLCICEDLLLIKMNSAGLLLCDFFINTIAETQNFSRFKNVFVHLTNFMYSNGRTFNADVAAHVLERIIILPYDEGLARALIKIIRNTEACIFSDHKIGYFEQYLIKSNMELYHEFHHLKNQVLQKNAILGNCYQNSTQNDMDGPNANLNHLDTDKRYSPDTTNLDNLNKTNIEPKFTRTIDLNKINFLNVNSHMSNSSSSDSEDNRFTPKNQFKNWRGRKPYGNMRHTIRNPLMRPPLRPPFKRRLDQAFDGGPSKFQRRNGFRFFKDFS